MGDDTAGFMVLNCISIGDDDVVKGQPRSMAMNSVALFLFDILGKHLE